MSCKVLTNVPAAVFVWTVLLVILLILLSHKQG